MNTITQAIASGKKAFMDAIEMNEGEAARMSADLDHFAKNILEAVKKTLKDPDTLDLIEKLANE